MKQKLKNLEQKLDALTLRERAIVFAAVAFVLLFIVNRLLLDPQFARQKQAAEKISQSAARANEMRNAIQQKITQNKIDPDAAEKERLQVLKQHLKEVQGSLLEVQKGLVPPEKMSALLEDIIRRNGKLQLIALKTLPVVAINDKTAASSKNGAEKTGAAPSPAMTTSEEMPPPEGYIYKHGVEITVQGSYADMVNYVAELEKLPWRLFWGKARLNAEEYSKASLTLTVFTLSLDKKWLNL